MEGEKGDFLSFRLYLDRLLNLQKVTNVFFFIFRDSSEVKDNFFIDVSTTMQVIRPLDTFQTWAKTGKFTTHTYILSKHVVLIITFPASAYNPLPPPPPHRQC